MTQARITQTKRILIADDEANIRLLVRSTLEDADHYEISESRDGEEALAMLRTRTPDLLILDLMMPRVSGLDVLATLTRNPPEHRPPIIILSAKVNEEERARVLGATFFLRKPFSPLHLMETVERVLGEA